MRDITFFEVYRDKNDRQNVQKRLFIFAIIVIVLIGVGVLGFNYITIQGTKTDIASLEMTLNDPINIKKVADIQGKRTKVKTMEKELQLIERFNLYIDKSDIVNEKLLYNIFSRVGDGLFLNDIKVNDMTVKITGVAVSKDKISEFEHSLLGVEEFEYVFVESIRVDDDNVNFYDFDIVISAEGVIIEEIDPKKEEKPKPNEEVKKTEEVNDNGKD